MTTANEVTHTHEANPETGDLVQIVTPAELRRRLRAQGRSFDRPAWFLDGDQWDVYGPRPSGHEDDQYDPKHD